MKKIYITLFTLLCATQLFAQNSFAPVGTKWYYSIGAVDDREGLQYKANCIVVEAIGDTLLLGDSARKLEVIRIHPNRSISPISVEFIKQNGDTVYYFNKYLNQFVTLYHFGLAANDTLTVHQHKTRVPEGFFTDSITEFSYVIDSVDSVEINHVWLKRQRIADNYSAASNWCMKSQGGLTGDEGNDYIIEQYGSTAYMFGFSRAFTPESRETVLRCIEYNGSVIYKNANWTNECDYTYLPSGLADGSSSNFTISVFPNPAQNELNLSPSGNEYEVSITDITGKIVWKGKTTKTIDIRNLPAGLYVLSLSNQHIHQKIQFVKQ